MIYFISAGKGSRMNSEIPKSLHKINGIPNLVRNIGLLNEDYFVVVNKDQKEHYLKYISEDKLIFIDSGLGSGHAIMQLNLKDDDIIIWGDAVISNVAIINELKKQSGFAVPLKRTSDPYVNFICDMNLKIKEVLFSKYGETSKSGLQDCCIFKVSEKSVQYLEQLHNAIWKGRYITESGEFEYLYLMHYMSNVGDCANGYITNYPDSIDSYNTIEELKIIEEKCLQ